MLFDDQRQYEVSVPAVTGDGKPVDIAFLVGYLCQNLMKDSRKELFVLEDHMYVTCPFNIRPICFRSCDYLPIIGLSSRRVN